MARAGIVYFARAGLTGPIKVGHAVNVRSRIASLQCGNHELIYLIGWITSDDAARLEREIHRRFRMARLSGEWFVPTVELQQLAFRQENCDAAYFEDGENPVI